MSTDTIETWTVPFTEAQLAVLSSTPCQFVGGMVMCVKVRPKDERPWLALPLPATLDGWASESEPGDVWEVCLADVPMGEFEGLREFFEGW